MSQVGIQQIKKPLVVLSLKYWEYINIGYYIRVLN